MATSSRFFPNRIQAPFVNTKFVPISIAPNGSGTPTIVTGKGSVKSVARNSAGNFTVTLSNRFKALLDAQVSLQLASTASNVTASYTWTDATDTDSIQFLAGPSFPGALGNNLAIVVTVGSALANTVTYSGGVTTVTLTTAATTTPAQLKTYVNTTAASTLAGVMTIGTTTGTTAFTVGLTSEALTGGTSAASAVVQFGAITIPAANDATAETVIVQVLNAISGAGLDITAATGNLINIELTVLDA